MRTKKRGEKYISCLASNFEQPIAILVEQLLKVELPDSPQSPPRTPEVDYSTSLIVLLILEFEGWISWARHFEKTPKNRSDKESVLPWLKSLKDPHLQPIIARLSEVYFLRDAIVHNHIWTYRQRWVQGEARYTDFDLDLSWQSATSKVNRFVKGQLPLPSFPRTRLLSLIIVPDFVGRREVVAVFKTVKDALQVLDRLNYVELVPKVRYVRFGGKLSFRYWSLIGSIQRSFLAAK